MVQHSNGRFRIRGRLTSTADVVFGVTMNHPKGGFAGKYIVSWKMEATGVAGTPFDRTIPSAELKPLEKTFPATAAGLELVDCWCLTLHEGRGLAVRDIELLTE